MDSKVLDLHAKPNWSLSMAVLWVMTRETDQVAKQLSPSRQGWNFTDLLIMESESVRAARRLDYEERKGKLGDAYEAKLRDDGMHPGSQWMTVEAAWDEVRQALLLGTIEASGIAGAARQRQAIPALEWEDLREDPTADNDTFGAGGLPYVRVTVRRDRAVELWPAETKAPGAVVAYRTGAAGRPSSIQLIVAEMARRADASMPLAPTKLAAAKEMEVWLKAAHAEAAPCTAKTIRQNQAFAKAFQQWQEKSATDSI